MTTRNELKYYSSLHRKRFRDEEKKFFVEGIKIIEEGLESSFNCEIIFVTYQFNEENQKLISSLKKKRINIEVLKNQDFQRITDTSTPQGIAAVFNKPKSDNNLGADLKSNIIVCLDNISDPGNVGTIIRNCDWFGVKDILFINNSADPYGSKAVRASMGSIFHVKIFESPDAVKDIAKLKDKGYKFICSELRGINIFEFKLESKSIIAFSNEANGPSKEIIPQVDNFITIPRKGSAESLNVASASAVILSHLTDF